MTEGQFLERLRKHFDLKLPFVAYRKPEATSVNAFLQNEESLFTTKDFTESGFVFAPFDDHKKAILIPEEASEKITLGTSEFSSEITDPQSTSTSSEEKAEAREKHFSLVSKGLERLTSGELEKVVLSRKEDIEGTALNPIALFRELLAAYSTAFVYLWYHPKIGCWLAATPETLLKVEGSRFSTMALAGTQKFKGSTDVLWGEKERQEQQFVTDSILDNLENVGVSLREVERSEVYTTKAGNLLHLRTDIKGRLQKPEESLKKIISALHPTPAVCGLPKEKAKAFILSEENYDRDFYTGFLGELNLTKNVQRSRTRRNVENLAYRAVKKETDLYVNLRCMKIETGKAVLFIGGGITKDSNPEAEWEETVNKSQTMKKVLFK
jgi:isochorismate synthase